MSGAIHSCTALATKLRTAKASPWENGYIESFNARLRDELLNGEIFYTLREAQIVIESWRRHYNTIRLRASIGYKRPAPEVVVLVLDSAPGVSLGSTSVRSLAFVGQAVTNRIANATYVLDLGLQRPAVLANSNFVILQPC